MTKFETAKGTVSLSLAATLFFAALPAALAQTEIQPLNQSTTGSPQQSYTVPAGTTLSIQETSFAGSNGDMFTGQLVNPIRSNGLVIIPAGSNIQGQVTSTDPAGKMRNIQLSSITLPSGNAVSFNTSVAAAMPVAQAAVRQDPLSGQVTRTVNGVNTIYPRISMGPDTANPAAKILGGTLGGAALGAATGTLTGLTMERVHPEKYINSTGVMTTRGLAWGAAYGAGFGLLSGIIAAAATPTPVAVTTTNNTASNQTAARVVNVTLAEPVTVLL